MPSTNEPSREPATVPPPISEGAVATCTFQLRDLPNTVTDSAFRAVRDYVTALGIEYKARGTLDAVGSGTFVRWRDKFGILTAEHVVNHPDRNLRLDTSNSSGQTLRVIVTDRAHEVGFDARALRVHMIGPNTNAELGPDMAIIELPPCPPLWAIDSIKSFWNLTHRTPDRIQRGLDSNGLMFIAGHPGEDMHRVPDVAGFTDVLMAPGLVGLTGQTNYFEQGHLDYLEVESQRDEVNEAPRSWAGVSGGSLWRVPIMRNLQGEYSTGDVTLAGVPYLQEYLQTPGHIRVRGHGPLTLYRELLSRLP